MEITYQTIINEINHIPVSYLEEVYRLLHSFNSEKEEENNDFQGNKKIDLNKFSFLQSIEASKEFEGSLSDSLIEERRLER